MISGQLLPDHLVNNLVQDRLSQPDCKVNGWVLEGYPMSVSQFNQLKALNVKPTATILLQQDEQDCTMRLKDRRVDPYTGISYNTKLVKLKDPHLQSVLHEALKAGNEQKVADLGFGNVAPDILDILALGLNDAKVIDV
jgi:adenylate kinase family enzyme